MLETQCCSDVSEPQTISPPDGCTASDGPASFNLLGVRVHAMQIPTVIATMREWIRQRGAARFVAVANVHMIMEAQHHPDFKEMLNCSGLTVPDGKPLVWFGRSRGHALERRVYGPELLEEFCRHHDGSNYRHFFYGGAPGVPEQLASRLRQRFPGVELAGVYSPPFRPLTTSEDDDVVQMINDSRADVLWVGLGCPKQERWMYEHCHRLNVPVMVGVGQAFDIHAGRLRQAPRFLREHGLEWLFRLLSQPRRLWRRYLVYNSLFLLSVFLESAGWKRFN